MVGHETNLVLLVVRALVILFVISVLLKVRQQKLDEAFIQIFFIIMFISYYVMKERQLLVIFNDCGQIMANAIERSIFYISCIMIVSVAFLTISYSSFSISILPFNSLFLALYFTEYARIIIIGEEKICIIYTISCYI